jgi:hypothetical protein
MLIAAVSGERAGAGNQRLCRNIIAQICASVSGESAGAGNFDRKLW